MLQTQNSLEVVRALNALQIKTGQPVFLPERELINEEVQIIDQLRVIFRKGRLEALWSSITTVVPTVPDKIEELLQWLDGEKVVMFPVHLEETINLFSSTYSLGKIKPVSIEGKLANEREVREKLMQSTGNEDRIELNFVPVNDGTFIKEYLDWISGAE